MSKTVLMTSCLVFVGCTNYTPVVGDCFQDQLFGQWVVRKVGRHSVLIEETTGPLRETRNRPLDSFGGETQIDCFGAGQ